jgi:hypothetical protein
MFDATQTAERATRLIPNSTVHTVPRPAGHALLGQTHQILDFLQA